MKAWNEGYKAFMQDIHSECPYAEGTQEYEDWVDGFMTASYKHTH